MHAYMYMFFFSLMFIDPEQLAARYPRNGLITPIKLGVVFPHGKRVTKEQQNTKFSAPKPYGSSSWPQNTYCCSCCRRRIATFVASVVPVV